MRATHPIWPMLKQQGTTSIVSGLSGSYQACYGVAPMKLKTATGGQSFLTWTATCKELMAPVIRVKVHRI
jgi:hypothetical protein